ncbi:sodium:cation symporter [Lactobacillus sp. DCY120]|uniref:Sodium:cation symporter n=1 Tax=Bombilactobacillus apium TaxID=2675299 RepID=A0A850R2N2_9LACO|nr:SLC13 family permease [Bombilactobacillus apium]NVY96271.1 sodium:cation symporter [Bombilactobacillus apium]
MAIIKNIFADKMLWIATAAALLTTLVSTPRVDDINFHTIYSLLSMMILVQIFEHLGLLQYLSKSVTTRVTNTRQLMLTFTLLAFVGAMFLTNDVTVLIMIPIFFQADKNRNTNQILGVILITVAANLGSAVTPFGNTHNLFLLSHYNLDLATFFKMSLAYLVVGLVILSATTLLLNPKHSIKVDISPSPLNPLPLLIALLVTGVIFLGIFKVIPIWIAGLVAVAAALVLDYRILFRVDYATILVFVCFFIAVGNISRFEGIAHLIRFFVHTKLSTFLTSIFLSQFISNVPSTILIAKFTSNIPELFFGSNVGGLGTTVASMCNLLAYKQYMTFSAQRQPGKYLSHSIILNLILLLITAIASWLVILHFC